MVEYNTLNFASATCPGHRYKTKIRKYQNLLFNSIGDAIAKPYPSFIE